MFPILKKLFRRTLRWLHNIVNAADLLDLFLANPPCKNFQFFSKGIDKFYFM